MLEVDVASRLGSFELNVAFSGGEGVTALFGPSGSGKSSVIKLIAGLAAPDRGHIALDDRLLCDTSARVNLRPHRRRVGVVFQESRLLPHFSVRHNMHFGRWFCPPAERRIEEGPVVETLGIGHLMERRPETLSGGEKQRVAIARALLSSPRLLLMDEPLAALDWERRREILPLIERLRDDFSIPIVYVSHAVEEVARLAARVVVLDRGRVVREGAPADVLHASGADTGDRFGIASVLEGRLGAPDVDYGLTPVDHPAGRLWLTGVNGPAGRSVRVVVRATDVSLATERPKHITIRTALKGEIAAVNGTGPQLSLDVKLEGGAILVAAATRRAVDELGLRPGVPVFALIKSVAIDERPV
ncbi:molybdenum ABC transporter ATP-binding protein [Oryzibacter oryziterrae]|uniref:molybdenum ABC transporter ATP-binding protein n=1 Tax=Oryzibacter oryziterrae TaxID=2766474 RepID=UPI001F02FA8D|nr:molybdenum ABC transporter ATP-binding protein [Oryzibacter oryziterrae]